MNKTSNNINNNINVNVNDSPTLVNDRTNPQQQPLSSILLLS